MNLRNQYLTECKNDFNAFRRLFIVICIATFFLISLTAFCKPRIDFKDNVVITCDSTLAMNDSIITVIKNGNIYIIKGTDTLVKSE